MIKLSIIPNPTYLWSGLQFLLSIPLGDWYELFCLEDCTDQSLEHSMTDMLSKVY